MAVIPQFNANIEPAQSRGPVLESGQSARFDSSEQLGALGTLAQRIAGMGGGLPNVSPDQGQGLFAGVQNAAQGLDQLGGVIAQIRRAKQDNLDYKIFQDFQMEMDVEGIKFEEWKEKANPQEWSKERDDRFSQVEARFLEGREVSDRAKEAITNYSSSFNRVHAVKTDVAATKKIGAQAFESLQANILRGVEANDYDGVNASIQLGLDLKMYGEDDAVRMMIKYNDDIDTKVNSELNHKKDTALLYRDDRTALEFVQAMKLPQAEKQHMEAEVRQVHGYNILKDDVMDLINTNPILARKALQNELPDLYATDRAAFIDLADREINEENLGTMQSALARIEQGASLEEVTSADTFKALPEIDQLRFKKKVNLGARNDVSEYLSTLNRASNYDPKEDRGGHKLKALRTDALLGFEGERQAAILQTLEERSDPNAKPITASQRVMTETLTAVAERIDREDIGGFKLREKVKLLKNDDGVEFYGVEDPGGDHTRVGFFGIKRYREVKLSGEDEDRFKKEGNDNKEPYEDVDAKEEIFGKSIAIFEEVQTALKNGEAVTPDEIRDLLNTSFKGFTEQANEATIFERPAQSTPTQEYLDTDSFLKSLGY